MVRKSVEMPETNLKHYEQYKDKLIDFAKAIGIKVIFKHNPPDEGLFVPKRNAVYLDNEMSDSSTIACLLHELGHCLDVTFISPVLHDRIEDAYARYNKNKNKRNDKKLVIQCEQRAWTYGRGIAYRLKINLGKWYTDAEKCCLSTYKNY